MNRDLVSRIICFCSPFFMAVPAVQAQEVKFERISLEQGLSQTSVFSITQDAQGFMWFATQDGLNRYDGYSFTVFRHDALDSTSLSDSYVTAVCVDRHGTLWAGTRGGGLNRYISETGQFVRYLTADNDPHSLSNNEVRCLLADKEGTIWVGTPNGLNKFDRSSGKFVRYETIIPDLLDPRGQFVESLYEDSSGNLWVGMLRGLAVMDRSHESFTSIALSSDMSLFLSMSERNGEIWFGTQEGLFFHKRDRWLPGGPVLGERSLRGTRRLLRDAHGNMWFGGDGGLSRYSATKGPVTTYVHETGNPLSLSGNSVISLFEDRSGILWIGTFDGINKLAPEKYKFDHIAWGVGESGNAGWNKVRGFSEDRSGKIWVATQEGLMTYDKAARLKRIPTDPWYTNAVATKLLWGLLFDARTSLSTLWVGTNGQGLIKLEIQPSGGSRFTKYVQDVNDPRALSGLSPNVLYQTKDGTIWVGTLWEGLNRYNRKTESFTQFRHAPTDPQSISSDAIWALCEDRNGSLWVGTAGGGLNKMDVRKGTFMRYLHDARNSRSVSDDKVLTILEGTSEELWIGTYSGLNRMDTRTGEFEHFTVDDGLPNNVVYGVLADDSGNLWLSTNRGISRFTIATRTFRNYDANDGLQSNEFNHGATFRSRSGEMYFGGVNGFNVFIPGNIRDNTKVPEVVFTDFRVFDRSLRPSPDERRLTQNISQADVVNLTYEDAVFSIEFAALEYTNPLKNQYMYMMEGFDDHWRYARSKREATYTNLDPGEYLFRVKASNNDGAWNEKGAALKIVVTPPFWKSWWFRSLLATGFLAVGPLIYYRRVTSLKHAQAVQQEFSRKLIESQESERQRIAAELHDSIGQDLLVIKNRLLLGREGQGATPASAAEFQETIDHVTRSLSHVREISRNLRPVQLDQIGLTAALEAVVDTVADASRIHFTPRFDNVDKMLSKEGEINLFRIVQEALNNVLKHSRASHVNISLTRNDGSLVLVIEDDGKGLQTGDRAEGRPGLGLSSMSERARMLGGELHIDSTAGRGLRISLRFPIEGVQRG